MSLYLNIYIISNTLTQSCSDEGALTAQQRRVRRPSQDQAGDTVSYSEFRVSTFYLFRSRVKKLCV